MRNDSSSESEGVLESFTPLPVDTRLARLSLQHYHYNSTYNQEGVLKSLTPLPVDTRLARLSLQHYHYNRTIFMLKYFIFSTRSTLQQTSHQ